MAFGESEMAFLEEPNFPSTFLVDSFHATPQM